MKRQTQTENHNYLDSHYSKLPLSKSEVDSDQLVLTTYFYQTNINDSY